MPKFKQDLKELLTETYKQNFIENQHLKFL